MAKNLEKDFYENSEMQSLHSELSSLEEEIKENPKEKKDKKKENQTDNPKKDNQEENKEENKEEENKEEENKEEEKKEESFTFKPIAISTLGGKIRQQNGRNDNLTAKLEFAGGYKNLNVYGYTRKDWNNYVKGFNEGVELFATENVKLGENFDINGKQFYRGKGNGRLMVGPQIPVNGSFGNVNVGGSVGAFLTYDSISGNKDQLSGSGMVTVNFSVKGKNGKTRNGDAFLNISGIKGLNTNEYSTYGEATLKTPNLLDPKTAGALCGVLWARYGGSLKEIKISYLGLGLVMYL